MKYRGIPNDWGRPGGVIPLTKREMERAYAGSTLADLLACRPGGVIHVRHHPIEYTIPNRLKGVTVNSRGEAV